MICRTAGVSSQADIGGGTRVWRWAQARERAAVGRNCSLTKGVHVDFSVWIGDNVVGCGS